MELNEKDIKKLIIIALVIVLAFLVFFLIKPIILTIFGGLILAYIFLPLYRKLNKSLQRPWLSSLISTVVVVVLIVLPLWFFVPIIIQQLFHMFLALQGINISDFVISIFPTASDQFVAQTSLAFDSFISKMISGALAYLTNIFLSFPALLLHIFLLGFVFFFSLRDGERIKIFLSEISPFNSIQNKLLLKQFRGITDSVVYGQVVIGIVQGIVAGIAMLIFGIPNALILTLLSIMLGIIPVIGPGFVYIPVTIYLASTGQMFTAVLYLVFNIVVVSSMLDSILRTYIISRKAQVHPLVLFVGMIGGLFMLGILGVIIGPLILSYFITLLKEYREKTFGGLFKQ